MADKHPKPPYNVHLITIEDSRHPTPDRGRLIAAGKTARVVDINASPPPPDAVEAIFAAKQGRKLPCTFRRKADGGFDRFREGSYEI